MSKNALPPEDQEMTLVQHLLDLKSALTKSVIAIIVIFIFLFPFANEIYTYMAEPLTRFLPDDTSMIATGVASPFLTPFKLSLVLAIYLAMPVLLYQIWSFIAPALYKHERQLIAPVLFFSSFLFYAGGAFAFYVVFPLVFGFLSTAAPEGVTIATDISLYLDFVIKMFFAFGFAFEVPVVVVLLILTGIATPEKLSHARPYVIVGAFVIGMLLTPPDIISQTLLAIPVWILYEAGIIVGRIVKKSRDKSAKKREPSKGLDDSDEDYESNFDNDFDDEDYEYEPYQSKKEQKSTATKENKNNSQNNSKTIPEEELDTRYADQQMDDTDWEKDFDKIDSDFGVLDKEYQEKQNGKTGKTGKADDETKVTKNSSTSNKPKKD